MFWTVTFEVTWTRVSIAVSIFCVIPGTCIPDIRFNLLVGKNRNPVSYIVIQAWFFFFSNSCFLQMFQSTLIWFFFRTPSRWSSYRIWLIIVVSQFGICWKYPSSFNIPTTNWFLYTLYNVFVLWLLAIYSHNLSSMSFF